MEVIVGAAADAALSALFESLLKAMPGFAQKNKQFEKEINELKTFWECLKGFLCDAEKKQFADDRARIWLQDLEHLAYDVEDVLEYFNYEELKSQIAKPKPLDKVKSMISLRKIPRNSPKIDSTMRSDLERINKKLQHLVKNKEFLNLLNIHGNNQNDTNHGRTRDPSGSSPATHRLYGREDEIESLVDRLLWQEGGDAWSEVIPIVGMGGIGKTSLVKQVYNDVDVDRSFVKKVWICVSKDYDKLRIMRSIMQAVLSSEQSNQELSLIEDKIRDSLRNKKLLLILDDFWNKSYSEWLNLYSSLLAVAPGIKIIVTTRNADIAEMMNKEYIRLSGLSKENCWLLFCEHARLNPTENPRFVTIGREIVKKCSNLPLAVMAIAGIFISKTREEQWESVRNSKLLTTEDDVMPILRMSYDDLSSELKRCFSICAIFPEDYVFQKKEVVRLWIGARLISHDGRCDLSIEDRGRDLFQDLVSKCLINKRRSNFYVMHDLVRELAQQISGTTCCSFPELSMFLVERCRHFSSTGWKVLHAIENLNNLKMPLKLRTFIAFGSNLHRLDGRKNDLGVLFTNMKYLRMLSLRGYKDSELPESLSMLKLLRYLDLTSSQLTKLPNSVTTLYNLEYLNLKWCIKLNELPSDFGRLVNLWYLNISKSGINKELPKGIEELKKLRKLSDFIVDERNVLSLATLGGMSFLKGKLNVSSLQNVTCVEDARKAKLREKKLQVLSLEWDALWRRETVNDSEVKDSEVLEELQPEANLKTLKLTNYDGEIICSWLKATKLRQLKELHLHDCTRCTALPSMSLFPFLRHVSVIRMSALKTIGMDWYGCSSDVFPKLETLKFQELKELQEWEYDDGIGFPMMNELQIIECQRLCISRCRDLLASMPKLTRLYVGKCEELVLSLPQLPLLQSFTTCDCKEVTCVEDFYLDSLEICVCYSRMSDIFKEKIKNGVHHASSLIIDDTALAMRMHIISRPQWVLPSLSLVADEDGRTRNEMNVETLMVKGSRLERLPIWIYDAQFLRELTLTNCASLNVLGGKGQSFRLLHKLHIEGCPNIMLASNCPDIIHQFTSLEEMSIEYSLWNIIKGLDISFPNLWKLSVENGDGVEAFPGDNIDVLFPNLKYLDLSNFSDLTHLTSLKDFKLLETIYVSNCPRLEMSQDEKLPSSLIYIFVHRCVLIEEKLIRKISHCPIIRVVDER